MPDDKEKKASGQTKSTKEEPAKGGAEAKSAKKPGEEVAAAKKTAKAPTKGKTAKTKPKTAKKRATKKSAGAKKSTKKVAKKPETSTRSPLAPKTYFAKRGEVASKWRLIDANGLTLGRLSTYIANALRGKDNPFYTRHADTGDSIVVINAEKVKLTGKKWKEKLYHYHTGFPGGIKSFNPEDLLKKFPDRIIRRAVYGMLPKGHMGRKCFKKLKVYAGESHPHEAQKPEKVEPKNLGMH